MLLVSDIGNTQTVIGLYDDAVFSTKDSRDNLHRPLVIWRIATDKNDAPADLKYKLYSLLQSSQIDSRGIEKVAFASVVPTLTLAWNRMIEDFFGFCAIKCTYSQASQAGLFEADYPNPHEIGADRIADAIAVRNLYGGPAIVVDFGTATNFEVIDSDGRFVGGIIAPGIMTGAEALFLHATKLAETELCAPLEVIGKSTGEALQSGIILGEVARVDGLVRRCLDQLGCVGTCAGVCNVIATGGLAMLVAEHSGEITEVRPDLTLVGLALLAKASPS